MFGIMLLHRQQFYGEKHVKNGLINLKQLLLKSSFRKNDPPYFYGCFSTLVETVIYFTIKSHHSFNIIAQDMQI